MQFYYEEPPTPLERVQALAEHLNLLSLRVRQAVSQAVSETAARLAHDATSNLMEKLANPPLDPDDDEEYGSWNSEPRRSTATVSLAKASGLNRVTINHYRTGRRKWTLQFEQKLAASLASS